MEPNFDARRDHAYFQSLWEYRRPNGFRHSPEIWDERADEWNEKLSNDCSFRRDLEKRVGSVSSYLRQRGLLGPECDTLDVGCGPGRFVAEFARTCHQAVGLDLSERMTLHAQQYAKDMGLQNASFLSGDFQKIDVDALGWRNAFDLVFTSMSPAIGTTENLRKLMSLSRGWCFNCCSIHFSDHLEQRIAQELYNIPQRPKPLWDRRWFYSLFNLLWLEGYQPETYYHCLTSEDPLFPDERTARFYAQIFEGDSYGFDSVQKIAKFLESAAEPAGTIPHRCDRWYGWVLWDTRQKFDTEIGV